MTQKSIFEAALENNNFMIYMILLEKMKNPFFLDPNGQTLIHICVRGLYSDMLPDTLIIFKAKIRENLYELLLKSIDPGVRIIIKDFGSISSEIVDVINPLVTKKTVKIIERYLRKYNQKFLINDHFEKENKSVRQEIFQQILKTKSEFDDYIEKKTNLEFKTLLYYKDHNNQSAFDILAEKKQTQQIKEPIYKQIYETLSMFDIPIFKLQQPSADALNKYKIQQNL